MRRIATFCFVFGLFGILHGQTPAGTRLERWHEDLKAFADFLHGNQAPF